MIIREYTSPALQVIFPIALEPKFAVLPILDNINIVIPGFFACQNLDLRLLLFFTKQSKHSKALKNLSLKAGFRGKKRFSFILNMINFVINNQRRG